MPQSFTPENWEKIQQLFLEAVELPEDERAGFLSAISEKTLRTEVENLLAADDAERSFLESSPMRALLDGDENGKKLPEKIGNYRIISEIGRGGMGAVYLAMREDIKKQVALKLIKRGMDSDEIVRRFRREQQILAALEHPNIARLLDVGTTECGQPYLAMEYVAGEDLRSFCEKQKLPLAACLALFRKICAAVSYAHQNLVVHRDLKPSNILVTKDGEPKLLDFGISKLLTSESAEQTGTATELGMMTPAYASPEQIGGETVSTATDVYSLGVILFELLTGQLPFDLRNRRSEEALKTALATEPPRPSEAITKKRSQIQTKPEKSKTRAWQIVYNPQLVRGDLDNIVLKALKKETARRYSSVEQFSEDIRRHLAGLPVSARRDTFSYRASKFINRNKFSVISALLIALALLGGILGTTWQAVRAERARALAEEQQKLAEKRFGEVRQLANNAVFKYYEQIQDLEGATAARETLLKDATEYLDRLAQDAAGDVSLQRDLVKSYVRLGDVAGAPHSAANTGDTAGALAHYGKAAKILDNLMASAPNEIEFKAQKRGLLIKMGEIYGRLGKRAEAKNCFQSSVALSEEIIKVEPTSTRHLSALAQGYLFYGETLPLGFGEGQSISVASRGFPFLERALAANPDELLPLQIKNTAEVRVGLLIYALAREAEDLKDETKMRDCYGRATEMFEKAKTTAQRLVSLDAHNAGFKRRLFVAEFDESTALSGLGKTGEALEIQRKLLAEVEKTASEEANAEAKLDLAQVYYETGRTLARRRDFPAAVVNIRKAIGLYHKIFEKDEQNSEVLSLKFEAEIRLADVILAQGGESEALAAYREAFSEAQSASKLKDAPFLGYAEAVVHEKAGDFYAARRDAQLERAEYQKALELWEKPEFAPVNFGASDERSAALRRKLEELELSEENKAFIFKRK